MTSFWKDTSDGPTKEFLPSIPRQEPSAKVLSWDHDVVRCPTDFWISFNVKLERKHNRLELGDLWSPSPTKDEECSVYTPGRCPSGLEEFALGAKLGLITPLPNSCKFLVTPILASERCGPSDSVCWPSVMFGELALADEGVHLNPPCYVWGGYLNCSCCGRCLVLGRQSWTVHSFAWAAVHYLVLS